MRVADFDYELPPDRIAQQPAECRDHSRLMVLTGATSASPAAAPVPPGQYDDSVAPASVSGTVPAADLAAGRIEHRSFHQLADLLVAGDLLVVNDARVLPGRLQARRASGGAVELLMLAPSRPGSARWRVLARPARRLRQGDVLRLADDTRLTVTAVGAAGERMVEAPPGTDVEALLMGLGRMPVPPYIETDDTPARTQLDRDRYQTVYAAAAGAGAAPTAGLHFTPALLKALRRRGVHIASVTLHVGPGTFRPITTDRVDDHLMDSEAYEVPAATAAAVTLARAEGRRVIAVGTTSVRTLEHAADASGTVAAGRGRADLYIRPGYRFRTVDAMITNFHLPRSTPLMMVAALIGRTRLLDAYAVAIDAGYRFYSYGDAMLLLP